MTELGQVFTEEKVAELMVSLISERITTSSRVLDPCIGKNIFFSKVSKIPNKELVGIEVDRSLIDDSIFSFYNRDNNRLLICDFFDFNERNFDFVIMNPPYVRQELLNSNINSKKKIENSMPNDYPLFSKKSNLYVYFIAKALKHIKDNGDLVAIIYDSWLYTDFGNDFKKYLLSSFNIKRIIHFRHGAFKDVNVGATILHIQKNQQNETIEYIKINNPEQLNLISSKGYEKLGVDKLMNFKESYDNYLNFKSEIFTPICNISEKQIKRGTNAKVNKYFIFSENKFPPYTKKIIKNVSKVKTFSGSKYFDYILAIDGDINIELTNYLSKIKEEIQNLPNNISIKSIMNQKDDWYKISTKEPGSIIFNYYLRNNIHFLLNPDKYLIADNFYNIYINENIPENLAILNSTFTKYTILKYSKSQGRGLFKIQLNRFNTLPVINIRKLTNSAKTKLKNLGQELISTTRENSDKIIEEIDSVLLTEMNNTGQKVNLIDLRDKIENIKKGIET